DSVFVIFVMPGLVPGIHVLLATTKTWIAETSPAMTSESNDHLPLLLPQPYARRIAIGELDAGLFQHALDRRNIVARRHAAAFLEIDDDRARHHRALGQHRLIHLDETARRAASGWRDQHRDQH